MTDATPDIFDRPADAGRAGRLQAGLKKRYASREARFKAYGIMRGHRRGASASLTLLLVPHHRAGPHGLLCPTTLTAAGLYGPCASIDQDLHPKAPISNCWSPSRIADEEALGVQDDDGWARSGREAMRSLFSSRRRLPDTAPADMVRDNPDDHRQDRHHRRRPRQGRTPTSITRVRSPSRRLPDQRSACSTTAQIGLAGPFDQGRGRSRCGPISTAPCSPTAIRPSRNWPGVLGAVDRARP